MRAHGLTFIGPPADVLERFASKAGTRQLLAAHGLPTIPGSDGMLRDEMHALGEAERIGYPVLIKPSAGGGGKGMRMVRTAARARVGRCASAAPRRRPRSATTRSTSRSGSTRTATSRSRSRSTATATASTSASATARSSAATRRSSRRRPTPALSDAARADLAERAVTAVVAAGYENVGTLEFLVDATGNFYFIEINCRIQVEHPVTEMLTGHRPRRDADPDRRRRAARLRQADVTLRGHAIEFRINAEDPEHEFRPGAGVVERYHAPGGPGVRMDSHLYSGYEVPPFYDSLLGKLIVWGPDRATAIARGRVALDELVVDGLVTNVSIHKALLLATRRSSRAG